MKLRRMAAALLLWTGSLTAADAACPIEFAVYQSADSKTAIDFTPNHNVGASVTNSFRLVMQDGIIPGHVQWSEQPASRSFGSLMLDCPEGDATGEELAVCRIWQGVIYIVEADGAAGLLPEQGKPAPRRLLFSGLGPALAAAPSFKKSNLPASDFFQLSGCQE